jgi:hypothetical protein
VLLLHIIEDLSYIFLELLVKILVAEDLVVLFAKLLLVAVFRILFLKLFQIKDLVQASDRSVLQLQSGFAHVGNHQAEFKF